MSGGSWDYIFAKFEDVANRLISDKDIKRKTLGRLVHKIAKALHDIEWADSGDCSHPSEVPAIEDCLTKSDYKESANERLKEIEEELKGIKLLLKKL